MIPFLQGFGIGAGLIIAIGAQNSFVLSNALRKRHLFIIPFICFLCDALLITLGTLGVGSFISLHPEIGLYTALAGALFLFFYGLRSLFSALHPSTFKEADTLPKALPKVIVTTLAITLLNPHVYLDTLVLVGSVSSQFTGNNLLLFTFGACLASLVWFYALSFGGSLLEPLFRNPMSWKVLDLFICCIMWTIAISLLPFRTV